ncbi:MAG: hypothetical protein WC783_00380 [Candidatus Paceibacterota bacterium]|jgi:hypothetical protein
MSNILSKTALYYTIMIPHLPENKIGKMGIYEKWIGFYTKEGIVYQATSCELDCDKRLKYKAGEDLYLNPKTHKVSNRKKGLWCGKVLQDSFRQSLVKAKLN